MKLIRVINDFILGIVMLVISVFLLTSDQIVNGRVSTGQAGFFGRADVYIKIIAVILAITSVFLILRSINFRRREDIVKFHFNINAVVILTASSLIVYALVLETVGFFISTLALIFFLVCVYTARERQGEGIPLTKQEWIKIALRALPYTIILVMLFYFIFTKLLSVRLP